MGEADDRLEERHDARIAEAEGRYPLPVLHGRAAGGGRGPSWRQDAVLTDPLDLQELAVDLVAQIAEVGQVREPFVDVEVVAGC